MSVFEWIVVATVLLPLGIFMWGCVAVIIANFAHIAKLGLTNYDKTKSDK